MKGRGSLEVQILVWLPAVETTTLSVSFSCHCMSELLFYYMSALYCYMQAFYHCLSAHVLLDLSMWLLLDWLLVASQSLADSLLSLQPQLHQLSQPADVATRAENGQHDAPPSIFLLNAQLANLNKQNKSINKQPYLRLTTSQKNTPKTQKNRARQRENPLKIPRNSSDTTGENPPAAQKNRAQVREKTLKIPRNYTHKREKIPQKSRKMEKRSRRNIYQ